MGYDVDLEEKKITEKIERQVEYPEIDERTGYPTGKVKQMTLIENVGTTSYAVKTITPNGSYGGDVNVNTTASKTSRKEKDSGNKKEPKKAEKMKRDDVIQRYKEIDDALEDVSEEMDRINKAADRMYGAERIAYMVKANE
jgi:type I restriction-modification system DNA methylase subunit